VRISRASVFPPQGIGINSIIQSTKKEERSVDGCIDGASKSGVVYTTSGNPEQITKQKGMLEMQIIP
jgi:hypothetical protein